VSLHPLAGRFGTVAESYERGRPEYPPAVVGALAAELGLAAGAAVLDLAAGTGKLSRALLAGGLDVIAVEPQAPMRAVLAATIGPERVRDGFAEAIPLADASVAAVTVADAIHWFQQDAALREIARVLRTGGGLAVLTTIPDWSGASWAHEVGTLLTELRPAHPHFDGTPWQESVRGSGRFGEPREVRMTWMREVSPAVVVAHIASMSWVAALEEPERSQALERFATLVDGGTTPAQLPFHAILGLCTVEH
jgi:SAM-dependent methyltransferase